VDRKGIEPYRFRATPGFSRLRSFYPLKVPPQLLQPGGSHPKKPKIFSRAFAGYMRLTVDFQIRGGNRCDCAAIIK
jgi:hypothetical protein